MSAMSDDAVRVNLPMVCSCGDGRERCVQLRARAKEILSQETEEFQGHDVTDADFISTAVYRLDDVGVSITGTGSDQWFVLFFEKRVWDPEAFTSNVVEKLSVECDTVEDGFAAVVCHYLDTPADPVA